jgi:hypothetical protein
LDAFFLITSLRRSLSLCSSPGRQTPAAFKSGFLFLPFTLSTAILKEITK